MTGRESKKSKPAARRAAAAKRLPRPALGNDPFERGAALRPAGPVPEPAAAEERPDVGPTPTPPPTPPPTPTATPTATPTPTPASVTLASALRVRLDNLEQRVEAELGRAAQTASRAAARLGDLAREEASGRHARDLLQAAAGIAPALWERLAFLGTLRRNLEDSGQLDSFGMDRGLVDRAAPILDFLYASWWRVEVRQIDHVPAEGPVIVIANHGGALPWDALMLRLALQRDHPSRRDLRPLLDEAVMRAPMLGFLAARLGGVPAEPENALRLLSEGQAVGFFPEGSQSGARPWTQRYRVQQFGRGGFAKVAIRSGATIVPCAIVGSEETYAPLARSGWLAESLGFPLLAPALRIPLGPFGLLPLPARCSLRFGDPIATDGLAAEAAGDSGRVFDLTERTRSALQRMLDEDVAARRSVYL